jgi:hypothetical protein
MHPSFVFRLVKSKVSKFTHKENDQTVRYSYFSFIIRTSIVQLFQAPRASNAPDDVVSNGSANHRRESLPTSLRRHARSRSRASAEAQTIQHRSHSATPGQRTNALPTQESLIDTLYGAHRSTFVNDQRFPQEASEYHRRRRRRAFDIPPAPPYSLVDPRPELSVALKDLASCQIYYLPAEPCPTYHETMRRRRPEPLIQL